MPGTEERLLLWSRKPMLRKPDCFAVIFLLGLSAALWAPRLIGPIDLRYDAAVYYILGTSLADGKGYRLLNEPGEIQSVQYPPLLPALVALHQEILGSRDPAWVGQWLRVTYCLIFTAAVVAAYVMARAFLRPIYAVCVGAMTALYGQGIFISDLLFTEIPFSLISLLFVIFNRRSGAARFSAPTALAGVAAYLLRTAAIALLAAWVGESLLRRRWQQAAVRVGVALLPVLAWQGYIMHVTSSAEYKHPAYPYQRAPYQYYNVTYAENLMLVDSFRPERGRLSAATLLKRLRTNFAHMPQTLGEGASTGEYFWGLAAERVESLLDRKEYLTPNVVYLLWFLGGLVLVGIELLLLQREWLICLYLVGATALMCLTPWPAQFIRYVIPLTPFLSLALVLALSRFQEFTARRRPRWVRPLGWLVVVGILAPLLGAAASGSQRLLRDRVRSGAGLIFYDNGWKEFDTALAWLKNHVQPGEIVAAWSPHQVFLKTGCKAVMLPMEANFAKAQQLLDSVPVTYLLVDDVVLETMSDLYTKPIIRRNRTRWQQVYASRGGKIWIYRRKR